MDPVANLIEVTDSQPLVHEFGACEERLFHTINSQFRTPDLETHLESSRSVDRAFASGNQITEKNLNDIIDLPPEVEDNIVIAGGAVLDLLFKRNPKDIDLFIVHNPNNPDLDPIEILEKLLDYWRPRIVFAMRTHHSITLKIKIAIPWFQSSFFPFSFYGIKLGCRLGTVCKLGRDVVPHPGHPGQCGEF